MQAEKVGLDFEALVRRYLVELLNHGRSEKTEKGYGYALKYFGQWLTAVGIPVLELTREDAEQWIAEMRMSKLATITIRNRVGVVKEFYRWLVYTGRLAKDPLYGLRKISVPRKLPQILAQDDVQQLLAAAAAGTRRDRVVAELLYGAGCRRGELATMGIGDVDLAAGLVRVNGKTGQHVVPIGRAAVEAIREWLPERAKIVARFPHPTDALIVGRKGPLSGNGIYDLVRRLAVAAGLNRRVFPHAFRHAAATHLHDRGMDIRDVQEFLGHKMIQSTMIYTHVAKGRLIEEYRKAHPRA